MTNGASSGRFAAYLFIKSFTTGLRALGLFDVELFLGELLFLGDYRNRSLPLLFADYGSLLGMVWALSWTVMSAAESSVAILLLYPK